MLGSRGRVDALLPKGWPRRVRSAVVHAISMSNVVFTVTRSHAENHFNARIRIQAESDRLRREVALLKEEPRIKDSRMERIPTQRRPHYPPMERLAILELRAARGWSLAQTARRLLVTPLTVASWTKRLNDEGPDALVQLREPINRFPDFVRYLVRRLKVHCPSMGSRRIARFLARAGLHLGATTVRRMLQPVPKRAPASVRRPIERIVTAKQPNQHFGKHTEHLFTICGFRNLTGSRVYHNSIAHKSSAPRCLRSPAIVRSVAAAVQGRHHALRGCNVMEETSAVARPGSGRGGRGRRGSARCRRRSGVADAATRRAAGRGAGCGAPPGSARAVRERCGVGCRHSGRRAVRSVGCGRSREAGRGAGSAG